jgi:hypothetical protein
METVAMTDEQQDKIADIVRLITPHERNGFLEMLVHELRGRGKA